MSTHEKATLTLSMSQHTWLLTQSGSHSSLHISHSHKLGARFPESLPAKVKVGQKTDPEAAKQARQNKVLRFLKTKKKYIIVNIVAFFFYGGMYSFQVFSANFLGVSIFEGDPAAKTDSEEYALYLEGVKAASQGTLTFYLSFTVFNTILQPVITRTGGKALLLCLALIHAIISIVCASTALLPLYYLMAVSNGVYRSAINTVPFIFANQFSKEDSIRNNTPYNSGVAIATVAAMLPCGFTVCSAIMGPLIEATGDAAAPIYYTGTNAFLGAVCLSFLKT